MQSRQPPTPRSVHGKPVGQRVRPSSARKKPDAPDVPAEPEPENVHARAGDKRNRTVPVPDEPRKAAVRRNRKGEAPPPVVPREKPHLTKEALEARSARRRQRHAKRKQEALQALLLELKRMESVR